MIILHRDISNFRIRGSLIDFLLKAIAKRSIPILVTGEEGFPFYDYYRQGRICGMSEHSLGRLLVCQSVNMYHLRDIIGGMQDEMKRGAFPVLVNFSRNYLDENVPNSVSDFLYDEDISLLRKSAVRFARPVFVWEGNWEKENARRTDLQKRLFRESSCVLELASDPAMKPQLVKNILTHRERGLLLQSPIEGSGVI